MPPSSQISRLISDWQRGNREAENALFEALYQRLHQIALQCLRSRDVGRTLGATALVHEAYLRFRQSERIDVHDSHHFLCLAARVMRRILVDRARARISEKRGGDRQPVEFNDALAISETDAEQILLVDQALAQLAQQSPRQAELVELRYFAGFSEEESAEALAISARTARREWQVARTRLRLAIDGSASGPN
jgi:RNA polymerase sigma factor (TIGR02999 family)